jgi:transposase
MSGKQRRQFTAEQKVAIIKQHLVDKVPVSDLCEQHQILATQFYQWQKQLFQNGSSAFERAQKKSVAEQRKIDKLEAKLVTKNEVIAELMEENVKAKKANGEL